jgi:molybdate transport system substrate-binding protein
MPYLARRTFLRLVAVIAIGFVLAPSYVQAHDKGPVIFAAASLKDALDAVNTAWVKNGGKQAVISYAASSTLAKQIEEGAPADIFISADEDWMNYLAEKKLINEASRIDLLGNDLVLIAPKDSTVSTEIVPSFPLDKLLGDGKLAMANTESVPAGKYGKAALTKLGVWDSVKGKIAQADNVRAALQLVSRGEAPLGIVYGTDAKADPNVKVLGVFPEDSHPPIVYPIAVLAKATNTDARGFEDFLKGSVAKSVFEAQGFKPLKKQPAA